MPPSLRVLYLDHCQNHDNPLLLRLLSNSTWLARIQHLDLSFNYLGGTLPYVLANMTSLTHLELANNKLNGSIPLSVTNMKKLEYLDLSSNSFSSVEGGAIMGILGNLCKLRTFDLSFNSIGGSIEASHKNISKCASYHLEYLYLGQNMIGGTLPSWLGDFKYLRVLAIYNNTINGPIPISIQSLSYLEYLDLSFNNLTGALPRGLAQLKSLAHIDLSSNILHGALSESHLDNLSRLEYLDLSYNVVEWNISSNWSPPFQLSWIFMTSCKIQSQFPQWIGDQTKLRRLDFSDNNMSGELPQCFTSNQLVHIDVSYNQITGRLPYFADPLIIEGFFTSRKTRYIDLSFNLLSGPLVHHNPSYKNDTNGLPICQLSTLEFLDLQRNSISGTIPDCWGGSKIISLLYINLSSNNLSGTIPPTLSSSDLQLMDLGENKLVGNIPSNWGGDIMVLRLRGNQLVGPIPPTMCSISTLQFLDLSFNNLTGGIPRCFGHLFHIDSDSGDDVTPNAFLYADDDSTMVVLKGAELQYTTTLKYVVNLDLSCNSLTGSIPEEITNLSTLIGLNLSHNHLTGNIPNKIGEMTALESLDLSNNNLSGTIPPNISALTSLVRLNLSYNKLQGEIPTGHQLQVIEDPSMTYIGNPGLCGDPLPNKCRTNNGDNQPIQGQEKSQKVDVWEKPVLYLVIMSGFATGFWGVVGSLLLKTRFRFAFFQLVGNVVDYMYVQVMIRLNKLRNLQ